MLHLALRGRGTTATNRRMTRPSGSRLVVAWLALAIGSGTLLVLARAAAGPLDDPNPPTNVPVSSTWANYRSRCRSSDWAAPSHGDQEVGVTHPQGERSDSREAERRTRGTEDGMWE